MSVLSLNKAYGILAKKRSRPFFAEIASLFSGWCRSLNCTEVFSYNPQINAAIFCLEVAFIQEWHSLVKIWGRLSKYGTFFILFLKHTGI